MYIAANKIINYKDLISNWLNEFMDSNGLINTKNDINVLNNNDEVQIELIKACSNCSDFALKGRAHFHQNLNKISEF